MPRHQGLLQAAVQKDAVAMPALFFDKYFHLSENAVPAIFLVYTQGKSTKKLRSRKGRGIRRKERGRGIFRNEIRPDLFDPHETKTLVNLVFVNVLFCFFY